MKASSSTRQRAPIAVVGVSALFPGSQDAGGFWRDILAGRDLMREVPASHWRVEDYYDPDPRAADKTYARRGGFLDPVAFDALHWGLPPATLPATDTAQLLALIVAEAVLQDAAREQFATLDRSRISVILGVTSAQELLFSMVSRLQRPVWVQALRQSGLSESQVQQACDRIADQYVPWQEASFPGLLGNVVAGRIANRLNLGGSNCVVDAACASTFSALAMAVNELELGESDLAITGGVDTLNDIFMYMCFSKTPALSPSGDCRPFSAQADGTMLGEGLGMVALKRLADAERDGDRIYALLRGIGSSSDGRSKSVYAPLAAGQAQALRRAYASAGYSPATVELVEAHGTGTKAGDAAEFEGLSQVYREADGERRQWSALGSVKSQIGHTKAAAGAAGLFKVVMALHHGVLPPTIKVDEPNPKLQIEHSPFYLNTRPRPWIRSGSHPRRAAVSAFGFGGSNFHLTLEEYRGAAPRAEKLPSQRFELLLLQADSVPTLLQQMQQWADSGEALARLAWNSRQQWKPDARHRLALVVDSIDALHTKLQAARQRIETDPNCAFQLADGSSYGCGPGIGALALVFPGQGSQYLGMAEALALQFDQARAVWDQAAGLNLDLPEPLHELMFPRPVFTEAARAQLASRLHATEHAQPALAAHSLALLALLREFGVDAQAYAGHSFGELMALHAAGVFEAESALRLAHARGAAMRDAAAHPGAMCALAEPLQRVRQLIAGSELVIANHNAPRQVVVSGPLAAIARFEADLDTQKIGYRRLAVASAFHSSIVADASAAFADALTSAPIRAPSAPVYGNSTAARYGSDIDALRAQLAGQLAQPVRFVEMVEAMYADGLRCFVEVGPGNVLSGLIGAILGQRPHQCIALDRKGADGVESLLIGLGRLAAAGIAMQPQRLYADTRLPPPAKPVAAHSIAICGSNLGKPYPPPEDQIVAPVPAPVIAASPVAPVQATTAQADAAIRPRSSDPSISPSTPSSETLPMPATDPVSPAWLAAFQDLQAQTAAAHESFQRTMSESHSAYLRLAESALGGLNALLHPGLAEPAMATELSRASAPVAPTTTPPISAQLPQVQQAPPPPVQPKAPTAPPGAVAVPALAPAPASTRTHDLSALLLAVVADKTGYPVAMLNLDMDLEGDLGIDSIKRVEILAAMDEQAPDLPKVERARLGATRTLREIVELLQGAAVVSMSPAASSSPAQDLSTLLLAVVADKTGYPVAMLNLDMDLEGDLGIDSIKRVEILAAVDEQAPDLPKVERARLGATRTLREIVQMLQGASAAPPIAPVVEATKPAPTAPAAYPPALGRYELDWVDAPASGLALPGLLGGEPVHLIGPANIATALATELQSRGVAAVSSSELPPDATACVYLGALADYADIDAALALNREAFALARQLALRLQTQPGLWVTVQDSGGAFGMAPMAPERAWASGLPALVKTCALEWPQAALKAIDIDRGGRDPAALARALADELLSGGGEIEIALGRDGSRRTLCSVARPLQGSGEAIEPGDLVVVSGGARGVTAACLIEWARRCRARLVLLGRSALDGGAQEFAGIDNEADLQRALLQRAAAAGETLTPSVLRDRLQRIVAEREIRQTLAALAQAGSEAHYRSVAVEDEAAVAALLDRVRAELGPIHGLIHAAGVLADKRIADKTDAQFDSVFNTKVIGLRSLLAATAQDPLKLLCVFSSVSARCGNTGQADYAMANEVLSKVAAAEQRRRPAMRVKALGWGPWQGGMVNPALRQRFSELGVPMIPLELGARMFADEMQASGALELVLGGEPRPQALLSSGADARVDALELRVDRLSHGWLDGHSVAGSPVLPVVLVAEWLTRAARSLRPGLQVLALHELKVLKGIRLDRFGNGGNRLRIEARALPGGSDLALRVFGSHGELHYSARAELGQRNGNADAAPPLLQLEAWNGAPLYQDLLFHRGQFELIAHVEGVSDEGIRAQVHGVHGANWPGESWQLDAAALDGGLQLAVLYGQRMLGGPNLPTSIDQLRQHSGPVSGPLHASAYRRRVSASAVTTDIRLSDADGRCLVELIGVHNHALAQ